MREAEQEVMRGMVNDTWPGTAEDDMSEAMSRIDTSDPTVGARIMATAFAQRSNTATPTTAGVWETLERGS